MSEADLSEYYAYAEGLARLCFRRFGGAGRVDEDDLRQEALIGLFEAWDRYDPDRGVKFTTFARPRVIGAMQDLLRRVDPLSPSVRRDLQEVAACRRDLEQILGRQPLQSEIADALGVTTEELDAIEMRNVIEEEIEVRAEGGETFERQDIARRPDQEQALLMNDVDACIGTALDGTEASVILLRTWKETQLRIVAQEIRTAIESVRRHERKALAKLRACLEAKGWSVLDLGLGFD